jgi:hypothetical protein
MADWTENAFGKIDALGEPTAQFAVGGKALLRNLILAPLLIAIGAALEAAVFLFGLVHLAKLLLLGAFLIVMALMLLVRVYRNWGLRVLVYPEGVVRISREGAQALCWDEIDRVWRKKFEGEWGAQLRKGTQVLVAERADGEAIIFEDALPRLKELAVILQRETLPHLLPRAWQSYEAGQMLEFGKLRLSKQGLTKDQETLPWHDIREVSFNGEDVSIYKRSKWGYWFHAPAAEIPNYHVLQALTNALVPPMKKARS